MTPPLRRPVPGECAYCGARCRGTVCRDHADLPAVDPAYNRAVVEAEKARTRGRRKRSR